MLGDAKTIWANANSPRRSAAPTPLWRQQIARKPHSWLIRYLKSAEHIAAPAGGARQCDAVLPWGMLCYLRPISDARVRPSIQAISPSRALASNWD